MPKLVYAVKLCANPGKLAKLDATLVEWVRLVNEKIATFWKIDDLSGRRPPQEHKRGNRLIAAAAIKAWGIVKTARAVQAKQKLRPTIPVFRGQSLELDAQMVRYVLDPQSTTFDGWIHAMTLEKRDRVALPIRQYRKFREWTAAGKLSRTVHLYKRLDGTWFAKFFVERLPAPRNTGQRVGIDVGYAIAATTSTGKHYGDELQGLQRRTRWRHYRDHARKPYRQGLNRVAKQIIADHPNTDFACENLNFKGKRKRSATFRTRLSRFAYQHLGKRLELLGALEGFEVSWQPAPYTSQKCSKCGCVDSRSRNGARFCCIECGHTDHADVNAAININGGEAVLNYDRAEASSRLAYGLPEYPGTLCAPTT